MSARLAATNAIFAADPLFNDGVDLAVILIVIGKVLIVFVLLLIATMLMVWFERKLISDMQNRIGPNRAGPFGVLQTLADGIKLFFKEDLMPDRAERRVFILAPFLAFVPAPLDAYALRLIAGRKLYDDGTLVQQSPSLAPLVPGTVLRINGYDFARLGVAVGSRVRVKTPKGQAMVEIQVDDGVPRGAAAAYVNQPGLDVTALLDATARVTDLRVDSGADA